MPLSRRRVPVVALLAVGVLVVVGLALLALPFLATPGKAASARSELESAKAALDAGELDAAGTHVANARRHVDDVQNSVQGVGGDVWSLVPVLGGPVRDVRRLGNALDDLTAVAEIGVEAWPQVQGPQARVFTGDRVDLEALDRLVGRVREAGDHLATARAALEEVHDERIGVGTSLAEARDAALAEVRPLDDGVRDLDPFLDALPEVLGGEGERKYLVAMLNPAELRYSGGAALSLSTITVDGGRITVGEAVDSAESPQFFRPRYWKKVPGNPFHRGRQSMQTATYAPSWPVSGEELLNAYRSLRGRPGAGVVAVDVMTLQRLLQFTGPLTVPGYPTLTADNFVHEVIGNYDAHPDTAQRRELNKSLAPAFTQRLFSADGLLDKVRALHEMAQARHFAVYFRNDEAQAAFDGLGLTGDLSATEHDYLGVFSQNTNIAKPDVWQRRSVRSRVTLDDDGSARVRLAVTVHNDSPPPPPGFVDPRRLSYTTRWSEMSLAAFLPRGAEVRTAAADGRPFDFHVGDYFGRPFVRRTIELPPQARRTYEVVYDVPRAAVVADDGTLAYRLDLDPQGMVIPQAVDVQVRLPDGWEVAGLPDGWRARGAGAAAYTEDALVTSPSFELVAREVAD